ncbi:probable vacuolar amino acid transporter YPQ1 isoform X1 [Zingiber officinale]|uniref:probable vacuolar amino acid transporter YPQ1 isoform X1 n=1 Tax=Zingiber officinale TaxID=94328 RepID=UPI001C4C980B|nr:probable vacuolar amino acid transporter YPQ1 isoform X1 [Zingiber officinale]
MMDPEPRRCWSWYILQLTKIQYLVMCLPWFLVASGLVLASTPALTSRGFVEDDFAKVVDFFDMAVKLALKIKAEIKVYKMANSLARYSSCSEQKKPCVRWIDRYFNDCVCTAAGEFSFALGIVSLLCWGVAEIPQLVTNFQTKSAHGVSLALLLTWVVGDIFNLVGCLLEPVTLPTQLYTALLYTATTAVLVLQSLYYDYWVKWWKSRLVDAAEDGVEEEIRRPLNHSTKLEEEEEEPSRPIPTTAPAKAASRTDVHYTSARSLASSGTPSHGVSYLGFRSGPSAVSIFHDSSSDEDEDKPAPSQNTTAVSPSVSYGAFVASVVIGLPFQAKASMQRTILQDIELISSSEDGRVYGLILGWIMAAIYMGGRLPQIYLNMKRGSVEGLSPLMFIFAIIANATYVGSILVRSVEWERIKANAPWLLDAIVCVLLDLFIMAQFVYYKFGCRKEQWSMEEEDAAVKEKVLIV